MPSLFYKRCLDKLAVLFSKLGSLPDNLSWKNIYSLLLVLPSLVPKSAGFWGSVVGRPINQWASAWRKSHFKLCENKKNDILWLILHRAVRVRYSLKSWGYINNDKCAVCDRVETIEHCFLECRRVVRVWSHFSLFISSLAGSPFSVSVSDIFSPFLIPRLSLFRVI